MASENPHKSDDNSVPRIRVNKWVVYGAIAVVALIVSFILRRVDLESVSYTHLTLPTSYLV